MTLHDLVRIGRGRLGALLNGPEGYSGSAFSWRLLKANVLEVRDLACLKKAMGWSRDPWLGEDLDVFDHLGDLNDRRMRDAEVIGAACCNGAPRSLLEIGTGEGNMTTIMAKNATGAEVYTVNIPPEEIEAGGRFVTRAVSREDIGRHYRERNCTNVRQIFANTLTWEPDLGPIDLAFIDGCHDKEFVVNDTRKVLKHCRPGSMILWHDFNPELIPVYDWIRAVCAGVELLYAEGLLQARVLHVRDSWVGIYRVP